MERLVETLVSGIEVFRQDAGLADGGHEIDVAGPARKDVHVDVFGDAGSGAFADVHTDVESFGPVDGAEVAGCGAGEAHHFGGGVLGGFFQGGDVCVGDHHEMAGGVWIQVQDDEAVRAAEEDEVSLVVVGLGFCAEDASWLR